MTFLATYHLWSLVEVRLGLQNEHQSLVEMLQSFTALYSFYSPEGRMSYLRIVTSLVFFGPVCPGSVGTPNCRSTQIMTLQS